MKFFILGGFLGIDADRVLRSHTMFSIDWFTDNDTEAALRVTSSKYRSGLNGLVEDESVLNSISGGRKSKERKFPFELYNLLSL